MRLYAEGFDEPILVDGDPVRVEQIAWNLLSNAIKFSRSGGSIVVRVSRDGDDALLEVTDTGRGIAPAFLPHVFEMFKQADAPTTRGEGGLGIGLALVKSLVELHGGRVAVESAGPGRGATFKVWLPLHQRTDFAPLDGATGRAAPAARRHAHPARRRHRRHARDLRLPARARRRGRDAGRRAAPRRCALAGMADFDLLVSDVGMPHMDGYEMIAELRRLPRTAALPAIALTGYGRPQDVQRALGAGFNAHVDKPVDFAHMRDVIKAVTLGRGACLAVAEKRPRH